MKKILLVLASAAVMLSLCACGENNESGTEDKSASGSSVVSVASGSLKDAAERVNTEIKFPSETAAYTDRRLSRNFGIEADKIEDFAGYYCSDGVNQEQFIYIRAKTDDDVQFIKDKLQAHLDSVYNVIKNYTPEQAAIIEKATVDVNGKYVSLVISANADQIKAIFNEVM